MELGLIVCTVLLPWEGDGALLVKPPSQEDDAAEHPTASEQHFLDHFVWISQHLRLPR